VIAVTGANGYVGGRILAHLRANGEEAIALVRRPAAGDERERRYALAQPLEAGALDGIDAVVHAAYDLSVRGRDVAGINCDGSLPLLDAMAERAGRVVLISSLSAFAGARSDYGRAKLELEHAVLQRGGWVVRPGLVFGVGAEGLFGAMVRSLAAPRLTPMIGGGWQRVFLTHDRSLCELVGQVITGTVQARGPLFAAHELPTTMRAMASEIARARGRRLRVIPLPPSAAYLGLRAAELLGLPLPFRSDSVRSLTHPIPLDQVSALGRSAVEFPPFSPELWVG
jgi:nucleoside-diphosphate-sugar epimerase